MARRSADLDGVYAQVEQLARDALPPQHGEPVLTPDELRALLQDPTPAPDGP
jgi:hypothetical protein